MLTSSSGGVPRTNAITALTMAGSLLRTAPFSIAFARSDVPKIKSRTWDKMLTKCVVSRRKIGSFTALQ